LVSPKNSGRKMRDFGVSAFAGTNRQLPLTVLA